VRFQRGFERRFESIRSGYRNLLAMILESRRLFIICFLLFIVASFGLAPFLGENFFPAVDAGQIAIHVRPPIGTRIEDSATLFGQIEAQIRRTIPAGEVSSIVDNIGLPTSSINMTYNNSGLIGYQDGDIFVSLTADHHPTAGDVRQLRRVLPGDFPGITFSFLPADIVSQILNFGSPSPIDVQVIGQNQKADFQYALKLLRQIRDVPGIADARIQQSPDNPQLNVDVDRARISQFGLSEGNVTNSLSTSLAGSAQTAPAYWLDPTNGVSYPLVVQTPEYEVDTLSDLENTPITSATTAGLQVLGGIAKISRSDADAVVSHYNVKPVIDIFATTQDRDLGGVAGAVQTIVNQTKAQVPKGSRVAIRGQVTTMNTAFTGLLLGLLAAIVMIYLLIVVNFQSWLDPFVIITALPAALAGIVWMLFATGTTLSVPALTGAIMCMGVATANSILVVSFARERLAAGSSAAAAAVEAGVTRFRPVLMTALAMIIGMAPMALGLGEGGEQNAPLGRAVIGGLLFATCATLLFVPTVFSIVHAGERPQRQDEQHS
jgi:multidrug efflux pump subunit AcrB